MNALVVLTRGYSNKKGYDKLLERNKCLEKFHNKNIIYIIFHEGNITDDHQQYIQANTILSLIFIDVSESFRKDKIDFYNPTWPIQFGLGYRNMCNFWFCDFWNYLQKYDKILRIDEDCSYYSDYNRVFELLDKKSVVYGNWANDDAFVTKGLNDFTQRFMIEKNIKIKRRSPSGPYTNVLGLNLHELRKNILLKEYIYSIKKSNNIYNHRWGDLPLWGEALTYMFPDISHICSNQLQYYHGSHQQHVNM